MLHIIARVPTANLLIQRSMAKLFQSFIYTHLPDKEHQGFVSKSGKVFKAMNFRIRYIQERFEIDFVALDKSYEQKIALDILKNGLKLGEIHFSDVTVSMQERTLPSDATQMEVRGFVCAALKNRLTKRKIFLEPGDERHTQIITNNARQKYEALLGSSYTGDLHITPLWQSPKPKTFWYENTPYVAWLARYKIEADASMLQLLLDTGLGSDTMKNLGFLELVDG